jgi:hypothetical protein
MQNSKDDHLRRQLGYFFLQNPGRSKGKTRIKVELENHLTDYKAAARAAFEN